MLVEWDQWNGRLASLVDREITVRDAEQLVTRVRTGYLAGGMSEADARQVLDQGGIDPARIDRYLQTWSIARGVNTRAPRQAPAPRGRAAPRQAAPLPLPAFPSAPAPRPDNEISTPQVVAQPVEFPPIGGRGRG
jgi:hypothetical protein